MQNVKKKQYVLYVELEQKKDKREDVAVTFPEFLMPIFYIKELISVQLYIQI